MNSHLLHLLFDPVVLGLHDRLEVTDGAKLEVGKGLAHHADQQVRVRLSGVNHWRSYRFGKYASAALAGISF